MNPNEQVLAERLRQAYRTGQVAPPRDRLEPQDVELAYTIQHINTAYWRAAGRTITGCKIGLTSKHVQAQLDVDQPDFGMLFADMRVQDGGLLQSASLRQPRAEAEIAMVLGRALDGPVLDRQAVEVAVESVAAAIEIVDSRVQDWKVTIADTIADNASAAFYVLAGQSVPARAIDLAGCGMTLEINDRLVSNGVGANSMGHPFEALLWLARTRAAQGNPLARGEIILTGALGPMAEIHPGDSITATVDGIGTVGFRYGG